MGLIYFNRSVLLSVWKTLKISDTAVCLSAATSVCRLTDRKPGSVPGKGDMERFPLDPSAGQKYYYWQVVVGRSRLGTDFREISCRLIGFPLKMR